MEPLNVTYPELSYYYTPESGGFTAFCKDDGSTTCFGDTEYGMSACFRIQDRQILQRLINDTSPSEIIPSLLQQATSEAIPAICTCIPVHGRVGPQCFDITGGAYFVSGLNVLDILTVVPALWYSVYLTQNLTRNKLIRFKYMDIALISIVVYCIISLVHSSCFLAVNLSTSEPESYRSLHAFFAVPIGLRPSIRSCAPLLLVAGCLKTVGMRSQRKYDTRSQDAIARRTTVAALAVIVLMFLIDLFSFIFTQRYDIIALVAVAAAFFTMLISAEAVHVLGKVLILIQPTSVESTITKHPATTGSASFATDIRRMQWAFRKTIMLNVCTQLMTIFWTVIVDDFETGTVKFRAILTVALFIPDNITCYVILHFLGPVFARRVSTFYLTSAPQSGMQESEVSAFPSSAPR